jgi:hypothetical protein
VETVNRGRSGLKISRLCLGTLIFDVQLAEEAAFYRLLRIVNSPPELLDGANNGSTDDS